MHAGDLTFDEIEGGGRRYTLRSADGAELGVYEVRPATDAGYDVFAPDGAHLGTETDLPEAAMTITLHGLIP